MNLKELAIIGAVIFSAPLFSQKEASKWYFGMTAGLDFTTNPPTVLTNGRTHAIEGTACIADTSGSLLFYTSGDTIWNKAHLVMANGTGLLGTTTSDQAAVIVKQPGNNNIYFIFTTDGQAGPGGLCYTSVDMNLAAGMGSVTVKNTLLTTPVSEKLTATRHCNGVDIWVAAHDMYSNVFRTYLVTAAGVNSVAVLSGLGTVHTSTASYQGFVGASQGNMKFSPNGKKLALALSDLFRFELYDFDNLTGVVSNSLTLAVGLGVAPYQNPYSVEFSPDATKLYGTNWPSPYGGPYLYQWDLCAGSSQAVINSLYTVSNFTVNWGGLQLGPDGKIYIMRGAMGPMYLSVISNPNQAGPACNLIDQGQPVGMVWYDLPNFMTGFFYQKPVIPPFTYTVNPISSCLTASFTSSNQPTTLCAGSGYSVTGQVWNFGDPGSGPNNTSTLASPVHTYTAPGTYSVQLIFYHPCSSDTLVQQFNITPFPTFISADTVCTGQTLNLYAGPLTGAIYSWSGPNGFTSSLQNPSLANASLAMSGVYSLTVTSAGGCTADSSVNALVIPGFTATANTNTPCMLSTLLLNSGPALFYQWNGPGNFSSSLQNPSINNISLSSAGNYTLISGIGSCKDTVAISVSVYPLPSPIASNSGIVCENELLQLMVTNTGLNYSWTGPNNYASSIQNPTLTAMPTGSGLYVVAVTDANNCQASTTTSVIVIEAPTAIAWPSKSCTGQEVNLNGSGGSSYLWTGPSGFFANGQSVNFIASGPQMSGIYTLTTFGNSNNCSATTTVLITVYALPSATVAGNTKLCAPFCDRFRLKESTPFLTTQQFQVNTEFFADSALNYCFKTPGDYFIKVSFKDSNNCVNTSTLLVKAYERPQADFEFIPLTPMAGIETVTFTNASSGPEQNSWDWFFIDNTRSLLHGEKVTYSFEMTGTFPMALLVKNKWGCADTIVKTLHVQEEFSLYVPDAFTPNDDGLNELFYPKGTGIKNYKLTIFDRWGAELFQATDFLTAWNGVYKGIPCKTDVYVWKIVVTGIDNKIRNLQGHVTLYR